MQDSEPDLNPIELYQSDVWTDEEVQEWMDKFEDVVDDDSQFCPECQDGVMQMQEGCGLCPECGFSPCA
jgi:hypothetical protein